MGTALKRGTSEPLAGDRCARGLVRTHERRSLGIASHHSFDRGPPGQYLDARADSELVLAKDKTEQLYLASFPSALPDVRRGIRVQAN